MSARLTLILLLGLLAGWLAPGGAGAREAVPPVAVWPPPPSDPRIAFDRYITGPQDVGQNPSIWSRMGRWITGDRGENLNLQKPFAVAVDETGNLCITDTEANTLCYCDFSHKRWHRYDGAGKTRFASPVAVARRNGVFYVADSVLGKVFAFTADNRVMFTLGVPLQRPVGLLVTAEALYVADAQAHMVFVFGLDGKLKSSFGRRGVGEGEFNFPTCLAADGRGHVLVTDTMNCRVEVFDLAGHFVSQFGTNGDAPGCFARPKGVAADPAGDIYVVDALFDNFQIFNLSGQLLLNVGQAGTQPGGFGLPNGVAIGADNRIYVADCFNHRVQVFKFLGQP